MVKKVNGSCFGDIFAFLAKILTKHAATTFYEKALCSEMNKPQIKIGHQSFPNDQF